MFAYLLLLTVSAQVEQNLGTHVIQESYKIYSYLSEKPDIIIANQLNGTKLTLRETSLSPNQRFEYYKGENTPFFAWKKFDFDNDLGYWEIKAFKDNELLRLVTVTMSRDGNNPFLCMSKNWFIASIVVFLSLLSVILLGNALFTVRHKKTD